MLRRTLFPGAAVLWLVAAGLCAQDRPPAPEGFRWKDLGAIKASFLVPEGWFFKEEKNGDDRAFFISKESIEKGGEFQTGLSVNVTRLKKDPAPDRAALLIAQLAQGKEVQKTWTTEEGVLKLFGARLRITTDPPVFIEHALAIGNSRTNTLYFLMFESPESGWDEAWKKGEVMLSKFLLDDEY